MQFLFQTCERLAFLFVTRKNQMKVGAKKKSKSSEYCEIEEIQWHMEVSWMRAGQ